MENLYLTKLEQAIKDGNYEETNKIYIPSKIEFRKFNSLDVISLPDTEKAEHVYKITFYYQISGIDFFQLLHFDKRKFINYHLGLKDYDLKYILPENYFRDIDYNINRKEQIDWISGYVDEIYYKDYYISESKIEKIKSNIFTKEIQHEKNLLSKIMEVNIETTTKKRGRL